MHLYICLFKSLFFVPVKLSKGLDHSFAICICLSLLAFLTFEHQCLSDLTEVPQCFDYLDPAIFDDSISLHLV